MWVAIEGGEATARIGVQIDETVALMVMGDRATEGSPEPLDRVGVGIVGRGVHETESVSVAVEGFAEFLRAARCVDAQVVGHHERDAPALLGAGDEMVQLRAEGVGGPTQCDAVREPAITPVDGTEADDFETLAGRPDQALTASTPPAPTAGQGGMEADIDLILDVEVRPREQDKQVRDIGGDAGPQVEIDPITPIDERPRADNRGGGG